MPLNNLSPLFGKKLLILTHAGADVDSLASAAAIYFSLKEKSKITIGVPDHLNLNAKALTKQLKIPYKINPSFEGFDALLCVDFNKSKMLGSLQKNFFSYKGEKFLIDHHSEEKEIMAPKNNVFASKKAISTTELVYQLLKKTKVKIPKNAYACIASGIITDSASFHIADHVTFKIMAEVMEKAELSYRGLVDLFSTEIDFSQKIAALKAAKRVRIFKSANAIIAISDVGAFEADAANALIRIGANVAFCGFAEKGTIRISGRVNNSWMNKNKFDLARDVFNKLENYFPGEGGGHQGAAGFNGKGDDVIPLLLKCVDLTHKFISKKEKAILKEYT
ncbi:MAG: DHH family phosphoesterase [archaeon]|nr:DHH family phosphoesterase [archaeon]